jgi:hypothetical protein
VKRPFTRINGRPMPDHAEMPYKSHSHGEVR